MLRQEDGGAQKLEAAALKITVCLLILLGLLPILKLVTMETCAFVLFVHTEVGKTWRAVRASPHALEQRLAPWDTARATPPRPGNVLPAPPPPGGRTRPAHPTHRTWVGAAGERAEPFLGAQASRVYRKRPRGARRAAQDALRRIKFGLFSGRRAFAMDPSSLPAPARRCWLWVAGMGRYG